MNFGLAVLADGAEVRARSQYTDFVFSKSRLKWTDFAQLSRSDFEATGFLRSMKKQMERRRFYFDRKSKKSETNRLNGRAMNAVPNFAIGDLVLVESRLWPGMNSPGGVGKIIGVGESKGRILAILRNAYTISSIMLGEDGGFKTFLYEVKYMVEKGKEKGILEQYIKSHSRVAGSIS